MTLYDQLVRVMPSPIVELNRAVAVSMAVGPQAGLDLVDAMANLPSLKAYHLVPAVRGDLLPRLHRFEDARHEFERAASLASNARERELCSTAPRSPNPYPVRRRPLVFNRGE